MNFFLKIFLRACPALVLVCVSAPALAVDLWDYHTGDPCCGIPDENYTVQKEKTEPYNQGREG